MSASVSEYDVVVVGAGPAGLKAAESLIQRGHRVKVLEARDRVGGRVFSEATSGDSGSCVELGAQWLAQSGQVLLEELGQRFEYRRTETRRSGTDVVWTTAGERKVVDDADNVESLWTQLDMLYILSRFPRIDMDHPIRGNGSVEDISVQEFVSQRGWTERGKASTCDVLRNCFCTSTANVGIMTAAYASSSVGLANLKGADHYYFEQGLGNLLKEYSDTFAEHIQLNTEVKTIDYSTSSVVVTTVSGETFTAKQVLLAFPPQLLARVEFTPPLSSEMQLSIENQVLGQVVKLVAEYETPWWREKGYSGRIHTENGFLHDVFDVSHENVPILAGFITGPAAIDAAALPVDQLQRKFEDFLRESLESEGEQMTRLHFHNWLGDQNTLGAYASWPGIGVWKLHPNGYFHTDGPLHFAGAEYAKKWMGYIEGALQSGSEVAERIQSALAAEGDEKQT